MNTGAFSQWTKNNSDILAVIVSAVLMGMLLTGEKWFLKTKEKQTVSRTNRRG